MGKRKKAREIVLQALYEKEFSSRSWKEILDDQIASRASTQETVSYASALLEKTLESLELLDKNIERVLENWDMNRVSLVDKNIVRLALAEILFFPDVPARVVINEAVEIANRYSSADAGKFVNGILDHFLKEYRREER